MLYTAIAVGLLVLPIVVAWRWIIWMPGKSFRGTPQPFSDQEKAICDSLQRDLVTLAEDIGQRNVSHRYPQLVAAAAFIESSLQQMGYAVRRQEFLVDDQMVCNLDVERTGIGRPEEVVVVGAHYDTVPGSPGANDNGSAVVANLALARWMADQTLDRTVRFAFFVNEESPYYMTDAMGSLRYAEECQTNNVNVVGMICLETIGYFSEEPRSQRYPIKLLDYLYPTTGNFITIVGNIRSRRLVHTVVRGFRRTQFPSEGIAAPRWLKDIFRSDHASFWKCNYPALMITDTANFRYRYYHTADDTVDKIHWAGLTRVVLGTAESVRELAS